jgi:hypothetical protein
MSDQMSAWQLIPNGDAALFAIVRLSGQTSVDWEGEPAQLPKWRRVGHHPP